LNGKQFNEGTRYEKHIQQDIVCIGPLGGIAAGHGSAQRHYRCGL
jgi:hypothetical protein